MSGSVSCRPVPGNVARASLIRPSRTQFSTSRAARNGVTASENRTGLSKTVTRIGARHRRRRGTSRRSHLLERLVHVFVVALVGLEGVVSDDAGVVDLRQ